MLPGDPDGRFPRSHAFVIRGEVEALIDIGCGQRQVARLLERWAPDIVIISHSHPDHMSGLWQVRGAEVWSPSQHADIFWRFEPQSVRFVGADLAAAWIRYIKELTGVREADSQHTYDDGHLFDLGGVRLRAVHAPGHLDDHHVLLEERSGLVFSFDIDLTAFGPWYGHAESGIEETLASIRRVAALDPAGVISSHKGLVTDRIQGRLADYADIVEQRERRIGELIQRPITLEELVAASPLYGGHPYAPEILSHWEGSMICKHLTRMEGRGAARRLGRRWESL